MIHVTGLAIPFQAEFTNGDRTAAADAPVAKGGGGNGFGPHELLEAALATCLTMTVQMTAAKHGFPLTGVRSEVRIDRSIPGEVTLNYALAFDGPLSNEQITRLRGAAAECPVGKTLTGRIALRAEEE
jgi:putative redox protein